MNEPLSYETDEGVRWWRVCGGFSNAQSRCQALCGRYLGHVFGLMTRHGDEAWTNECLCCGEVRYGNTFAACDSCGRSAWPEPQPGQPTMDLLE